MRDPTLQFFLIRGVAWVGHFLDDKHFHLLLKIEWAAELQRFYFGRADTLTKIGEIRSPHCQSSARHDATTVVAKEHLPQHRREIDGRGVESEETLGFAGPLDPVNVLSRALLEKNGNAVSSVTDAPPEFLQLRLQNFVIGTFHRLGYTRLKHTQSTRNRIWNKIDVADTKLAAFTKI